MIRTAHLLAFALALAPTPVREDDALREVRGVTISCQTYGHEWGTDGFAQELDRLAALGVNWIAIHPYGRIHADGAVTWREFDPADPPTWLSRPVAEARARGMGLLVKPHLAYWGGPFSWRGEIDFEEPEARARFFADYGRWITAVARATRGAQAFAVGTELDRLVGHDAEWRAVIAAVRAETDAHLTYAANWTDFERVPFWDALDVVGVQGYFPLSDVENPDEATLRAGWAERLASLRALHERSGKPVVLTELGYNRSLAAAREPWNPAMTSGARQTEAEALQLRCLRVALDVLAAERAWLRGSFLWKWFVGAVGRADRDFRLDVEPVRALLRASWER